MYEANIAKGLKEGTPNERSHLLSHLGDVFEAADPDVDIFALLKIVIDYVLQETDTTLREEALDAIVICVGKMDCRNFDFGPLVLDLATMNDACLLSCFIILGWSRNPTYLGVLDEYARHRDHFIAAEAAWAIDELTHMCEQARLPRPT